MREKYLYVKESDLSVELGAISSYAATFFSKQKVARKDAAKEASDELKKALKKNGNARELLEIYEAAHLAIGTMSVQSLQLDLKASIARQHLSNRLQTKVWGLPPPLPPLDITFKPAKPEPTDLVMEVNAKLGSQPGATRIGYIYIGDRRFELPDLSLRPLGALNDVCTRRGFPKRHYIRYNHQGTVHYVRRYVIRGLNQSDARGLAARRALTAPEDGVRARANEVVKNPSGKPEDLVKNAGKHNVDINKQLTREQQILSHTRGWKKRFISTTTTQRAVHSTRGTEFLSVFGAVVIDLAFVNANDIFDLHAPAALGNFGLSVADLHTPRSDPYQEEQRLAAQDVVRTRELLIYQQVPFNAIHLTDGGKRVIGVSCNDETNAKFLFKDVETAWAGLKPQPPKVTATERLEYPWGGRWYKFYLFDTPANADLCFDAFAFTEPYSKGERFKTFGFPVPLPVGYDHTA